MSQTIDTIIAHGMMGFNRELSNDFYYALGDSNSLEYLDLSNNGLFSNIYNLGMAVSFNALKNGSLTYLDISFCGINIDQFKNFVKGLKVSENDHNKWYGFQFNTNILKDTPDYFNQKFHCNLETFVFNGNNLYENVNYLDPKNAFIENPMKTFITQSPKLNTLILCNSNFNKYFLDSIAEALREKNNIKYISFSNSKIVGEKFKSLLPIFYAPLEKQKDQKQNENKEKGKKPKKKVKKEVVERRPNPNMHIEEMDLSCNNLGYSGAETLSKALQINTSIKKLNLFHNLFDVNGARRTADVLKIKNNIEEIDLGYNKIKNARFKSV